MRKVEQQMVAAIRDGRHFKSGNTMVATNDRGDFRVFLHGNLIAKVRRGMVSFTLAGWNTPTTRSRVNALLDAFGRGRVHVCQGVPRWTINTPGQFAKVSESRAITATEWVTV